MFGKRKQDHKHRNPELEGGGLLDSDVDSAAFWELGSDGGQVPSWEFLQGAQEPTLAALDQDFSFDPGPPTVQVPPPPPPPMADFRAADTGFSGADFLDRPMAGPIDDRVEDGFDDRVDEASGRDDAEVYAALKSERKKAAKREAALADAQARVAELTSEVEQLRQAPSDELSGPISDSDRVAELEWALAEAQSQLASVNAEVDRVAQLEWSLAGSQSQVASLNSEIDRLRSEAVTDAPADPEREAEMERTLAESRSQVEELSAEVERLTDEVERARATPEPLGAHAAATSTEADDRVFELERALAESQSRIDDLTEKLDNASQDAQKRVDAVTDELEQARRDAKSRVELLVADLNRVRSESNVASEAEAAASSELQATSTQVQELERLLADAQARVESLTADVQSAEGDTTARVAALTAELEQVRTYATARVESLTEELKLVRTGSVSREDSLTRELERARADAGERIEALTTELDRVRSESAANAVALDRAGREGQERDAALADAERRLESMTAELEKVRVQASKAPAELERVRREAERDTTMRKALEAAQASSATVENMTANSLRLADELAAHVQAQAAVSAELVSVQQEIAEQRAWLTEATAKMREESATTSATLETLTTGSLRLSGELAEHVKNQSAVSTDLAAVQQEIAEQRAWLTETMARMREESETSTAKVESMTSGSQRLADELAEHVKNQATVSTDLVSVQQEIAEQRAWLTETMARLREESETSSVTVETLTTGSQRLVDQLAEHVKNQSTVSTDLVSVQQEIAEQRVWLADAIARMREESETSTAKVESMTGNSQRLADELAEHVRNQSTVSTDLVSVQQEIAEQRVWLAEAIARMREESETSTAKVESMTGNSQRLADELAEHVRNQSTVSTDLVSVQKEIAEQRAWLAEAIEQMREEAATSSATVETLTNGSLRLADELAAQVKTQASVSTDLVSAQKEIAEQRAWLAEAMERMREEADTSSATVETLTNGSLRLADELAVQAKTQSSLAADLVAAQKEIAKQREWLSDTMSRIRDEEDQRAATLKAVQDGLREREAEVEGLRNQLLDVEVQRAEEAASFLAALEP